MSQVFTAFEKALLWRNPRIRDYLTPALTEKEIQRWLKRGKVKGNCEPIQSVYSWKGGTLANYQVSMQEVSLFPRPTYMLASLEMMVINFIGFRELPAYRPEYAAVADRYFPLFWDGRTDYLAADLTDERGRIVVLEDRADDLVREAYPSLEELLLDAIRANRENDTLRCFPPSLL